MGEFVATGTLTIITVWQLRTKTTQEGVLYVSG